MAHRARAPDRRALTGDAGRVTTRAVPAVLGVLAALPALAALPLLAAAAAVVRLGGPQPCRVPAGRARAGVPARSSDRAACPMRPLASLLRYRPAHTLRWRPSTARKSPACCVALRASRERKTRAPS